MLSLKQALTSKQFEVVKLVAFGYSNKAIATRLGHVPGYQYSFLRRIYEKLDMSAECGIPDISNRLKLANRFAQERKRGLYA